MTLFQKSHKLRSRRTSYSSSMVQVGYQQVYVIFLLLFFKVSGETKGNNTCPAPCQSALKINEKCEVSSELLRFNVISFRKIQSQKNTRPHLACSISRYYLSKEFIWQSGFNILLINRLALEKNQHITENSSKLLKKLNRPAS